MAVVETRTFIVKPGAAQQHDLIAACADMRRAVPGRRTEFAENAVETSPVMEQIAPALDRTTDWVVQQAMIWMVRDNATRTTLKERLVRARPGVIIPTTRLQGEPMIEDRHIRQALTLLENAGYDISKLNAAPGR